MAKDYHDILNRKTTMDKVGDAFTDQANSMRPMNVGQRREQALMRGLGAGFGLNPAREAKLAELENMSKEATFAKINLEKEAATNQLKGEKLKSFIADYDADLQMASSLIQQGKYDQLDILAPRLISGYEEKTGKKLGQYLFSKNGHSAFKQEDGQIITLPIKDLLNPIMNVIPPENRGSYKGFATTYQAQELDAIVETRKLQQDQLRASTEASRASVETNKAQAELYGAKAKKVAMEAENPPMNDQQKVLFKANVESNKKYIDEEGKKLITNKILVKTLDETEEMLIDAAKKGQVGSDLLAQARRKWGKYISGNNKEMTIVDMAKAAYFARVKEAGGSNPSTTEFLSVLETVPNTDKNLLASLNILRKDKNNALNAIYRFNNIEKNLRTNNYQGSPYDENVVNFNENEFNNYVKENSSKKTIIVSKVDKNTGKKEIIEIPLDDFEKAYNDGYNFVGK
jgi:hypothetical protein